MPTFWPHIISELGGVSYFSTTVKLRLSQITIILKLSNFSPAHRRLFVQALAMTGADLSATSKPWDLQMHTVKTIYEEFYNQG